MTFLVKVCYERKVYDFWFEANGRFPYHSDIQSKLREEFKIPTDVPIFWDHVVFFPYNKSLSKISFKQYVCDAAEYEDAQKPFLARKFDHPGIGFTALLSTNTEDDHVDIIKTRKSGRALLKTAKNLIVEYGKLETQLKKDTELIAECGKKIQEATFAGKEDQASIWSIQMEVHKRAQWASKTKLDACISERVAISEKLEARTLQFPTLRLFLSAQDEVDTRLFQETTSQLDFERRCPVATRSISPADDPYFPDLDVIFSGLRPELNPAIAPTLFKLPRFDMDAIYAISREPREPGPSSRHSSIPQFVPRQPDIACALEAVASDFMPGETRRHMKYLKPNLNQLHNPLDAPYQRLWQSNNLMPGSVRDLRNLPPQPPSAEERRRLERLAHTPWPSCSGNRHEPNLPPHPPYGQDPWARVPLSEEAPPSAPAIRVPQASRVPLAVQSPLVRSEQEEQDYLLADQATRNRLDEEAAARFTEYMMAEMRQKGAKRAAERRARRRGRPLPNQSASQYKHINICCDGCNVGITGFRFKCNDCVDYDLCTDCLMKNQSNPHHPYDHTFNTITHRDLNRHLNQDVKVEVPLEDHPASCDLCDKRITGIRTKCTDCPDWDCCEACLPNVGDRHPGHTFVKINIAADLVEPPFRHQKVKHTDIICDMCQKGVVGDRWKCVHPSCNDFDLCNNCHSSPLNTHPREHPILKLSAPILIDFVSRIRDETPPGQYRPGKSCDFGRRDGEYSLLTDQDREDLKTRWFCRDHDRFETCERARIRCVAPKSVLQGPKSKRSNEDGSPPKRVKLNLPDVEDIKKEQEPITVESAASDAMEIDQPLESEPSAIIDEFAPGSHPDIIKCYIYPATLAICPAKLEDDRCVTPPINRLIEVETPLIDPSIDSESPTAATGSPSQVDITTPSNSAIFTSIKDVTIPAGCSLPVGAEFTKTWSMQHLASGHEYKFDQLRLVHESGGLLGEACNIQLAFSQDEIKMGKQVEVSIAGLKVPDLPEQQVVEQWRFRDVDGTAYGEPLRLRFTVENPSLQNSLCNSSFIMPPPDLSAPRSTSEVRGEAPSRSSVTGTLTTSQSYDSLVSLSTDVEDDFAMIDRVPSRQSLATEVTDDALASEFDFVDESDEARSQG